jgi:uroporphyrinogen-III decarboxylase
MAATDMIKAKEILGPVGCIQGNVPVSMMTASAPEEVRAYCRGLIEKVGAGGGYILDLGAGPENAKAENVHALVRAAKEYGAYRR